MLPLSSPDIFLHRKIARGDVLLCSAIVRELNILNPLSKIYFRTDYPEVFDNNPRVFRAGAAERGPQTPEVMIHNLDFVKYESMNGWHLIDSFAHSIGFARGECPRTLEMYPSGEDHAWVEQTLTSEIREGLVVVAPGPGLWEGRNWPETNWRGLIDWIQKSCGLPVVVAGKAGEKHPYIVNQREYSFPMVPKERDLRGKTSFGQLAAIITSAKLFVGIDSFPCHVAGAVKTPRAVLFGITSPECILCDSPNTIAITSDAAHPFTGIRHRISGGMAQIDLGRPSKNPMHTITVDQVRKSLTSLLCRTNAVTS